MQASHTTHPHPHAHQHPNAFKQKADRLGNFLATYMSIILAIFFGFLVLLAFLGPILSYFGLDVIAKPLFFTMHYLCAQTPSHTFYLFGHQLCLCERCLAIYSSMFLCSVFFIGNNKRLPRLRWWYWLLFCIPMALDGFTQMFGLRESDWILRLITGAIFGFGSFWFAFSMMQQSLEDDAAQAQARAAYIAAQAAHTAQTQK